MSNLVYFFCHLRFCFSMSTPHLHRKRKICCTIFLLIRVIYLKIKTALKGFSLRWALNIDFESKTILKSNFTTEDIFFFIVLIILLTNLQWTVKHKQQASVNKQE